MNQSSRRPYVVLGIVSLALAITAANGTIVAVALPRMLQDLNTSLAWVGWTLTGYLLAQGIAMPVVGKISDDWGARRVFLGAEALFAISSFLAGTAPNVYILIGARMLQALAHGAVMTSGTSIVSDSFGERRATAIGLFTSIMPLGGVLGPIVGGFVIDQFSWRWMFYANVPICSIILLLGFLLIPVGLRHSRGKRLDVVGIGLFVTGMVTILSAMTAWGNDVESFYNPLTWLSVATGLALLGMFLRHEGRTPSPIIEPALLLKPPFLAVNLFNFIFGATLFSSISFIPYYATVVYGMTASESGVAISPRFAAMSIASTVCSVFLIRRGYRLPMIVGFILNTVSLLLMSQGYRDISVMGLPIPNIVLLSTMVLFSGLGQGTAAPPSNNAGLDLVPGKVAAAAGLRGLFRSIGGVFGTAVIILVLSLYHDKAAGLQSVLLGFAFLGTVAIPLAFFIPDTARQRFRAARDNIS
ncbi:MAG: MFS transporter [Dehalococcoidia bacterium]|nr:MFS transporter [Dehalococcoidia bacterium]